MKSAGQTPNPLGSATVPNPLGSAPAPQLPAPAPQPAPVAAQSTAPTLPSVPWIGSCMYDRGNDNGMSQFSVRGLNSYALLAAVMAGSGNDDAAKAAISEMPKWHVLYEPNSDIMDERGSVMQSMVAPKVTFDRVCHEDTAWTAPDGAYQFRNGSLGNMGPIEFDSVANNRVTDLVDIEHEEQAQLFAAVKGMGMNEWSNRMVHYFGAFGDSIVGPTPQVTAAHWYGDDVEVHQGMAFAFRKDGMQAYMGVVKQHLAAADQSKDGVLNLIDAFSPIDADQNMVVSALKMMGAEPGQMTFAMVLGAGLFFNQGRAKYNELVKIVAPRMAQDQPFMQMMPMSVRVKTHLEAILASKDKADDPLKVQVNDLVKATREQLGKMVATLMLVDERLMTRDQREFLYVMRDVSKSILDSLPEPITIVARKDPPKRKGPGPKPVPPTPGGGGVQLPENF